MAGCLYWHCCQLSFSHSWGTMNAQTPLTGCPGFNLLGEEICVPWSITCFSMYLPNNKGVCMPLLNGLCQPWRWLEPCHISSPLCGLRDAWSRVFNCVHHSFLLSVISIVLKVFYLTSNWWENLHRIFVTYHFFYKFWLLIFRSE